MYIFINYILFVPTHFQSRTAILTLGITIKKNYVFKDELKMQYSCNIFVSPNRTNFACVTNVFDLHIYIKIQTIHTIINILHRQLTNR